MERGRSAEEKSNRLQHAVIAIKEKNSVRAEQKNLRWSLYKEVRWKEERLIYSDSVPLF